ncbi:MAG TPA: helix-turn-helix transcriptional regulator [Methylococcaceae bacterium]|nr:helix-turn-helix transcriptional regulator [Methylococcaceae bacterium]
MQAGNIHLRIKQARVSAGLSQAALAKLVGVQRSSASQWESDNIRKDPSTANLAKIAAITGVSFEWLATGRGEMTWSALRYGIGESGGDYRPLTPWERHLLKLFGGMPTRRQKALIEFLDLE